MNQTTDFKPIALTLMVIVFLLTIKFLYKELINWGDAKDNYKTEFIELLKRVTAFTTVLMLFFGLVMAFIGSPDGLDSVNLVLDGQVLIGLISLVLVVPVTLAGAVVVITLAKNQERLAEKTQEIEKANHLREWLDRIAQAENRLANVHQVSQKMVTTLAELCQQRIDFVKEMAVLNYGEDILHADSLEEYLSQSIKGNSDYQKLIEKKLNASCLRFKEKAAPEIFNEFRSRLFSLYEKEIILKSTSSLLRVELNNRILDGLQKIADQEEKLANILQEASVCVLRATDDVLANKVMQKQIVFAISNCIRKGEGSYDDNTIKELEEYFFIDPISLASVLNSLSDRLIRSANRYRRILEDNYPDLDKVLADKFPGVKDAINLFSSYFYMNVDEEIPYAKNKRFANIDVRPVGLIKTSALALKEFRRKICVFDSNKKENYFSLNTATIASMLVCHISPGSSVFKRTVQDESLLEFRNVTGNSFGYGMNESSLDFDLFKLGVSDLEGAIVQVRMPSDEEFRMDEIDREINGLYDEYFLDHMIDECFLDNKIDSIKPAIK